MSMICDCCGGPATAVLRGGEWVTSCCETIAVEGGCTLVRRVMRHAAKDYPPRKIAKGDLYTEVTYRHWRKGGPHWYTVHRAKWE